MAHLQTSRLPVLIVDAARRGWRLLPVQVRGKTPLVKEWQKVATNDLNQLEAWANTFPECNWGMATGPGSGVFVLDIDGEPGRSSLVTYLERGYEIPDTLSASTGNGRHFYFRWPAASDIRNSAGKFAKGIDIRGDGGYVVIAPSIHPTGKRYDYDDPSSPVQDAPRWLLEILKRAAPAVPVVGANSSPIGPGQRTPLLFKLAGKLRAEGVPHEGILEALRGLNKTFSPPHDEKKLRDIAKGIERYPAGQPQQQSSGSTQQIRAEVVRLSDVEPRAVNWLWKPYIPLGMTSMVSGDPGAGKSYVAIALCAGVTCGKIGDTRMEPADVLYMSCENPIAEVIRPRFDSMGRGDLARFWCLTGTVYVDEESGKEIRGAFTADDLDLLEQEIKTKGIRLVVIDPFMSYLGKGRNPNNPADTRPFFDRLGKIGEQYGCAVLIIRHNRKGGKGDRAIYQGAGTIDMTGAVRSEMLAAVMPEDPSQRALAHIKTNIGPLGKTQGYIIEDDGASGARFSWTGDLSITAEELNAQPEPLTQKKTDQAFDWLLRELRGGRKSVAELEERAKAAQISWATIRRAKKENGGLIDNVKDGMRGPWFWFIREDAQPSLDTGKLSAFGNLSAFEDAHPTKIIGINLKIL